MKRLMWLATLGLMMGCDTSEADLTSLCEEVFLKQTATPSSYKRVSVKVFEEAIDPVEYRKTEVGMAYKTHTAKVGVTLEAIEETAKFIEAAGGKPTRRIQFIDYDLSNLAGAMVRGKMSCKYDDLYSDNKVNEARVRVNGYSYIERLRLRD